MNANTETVVYQIYKLEASNKLIQKIVHITFFNDMINIKIFDPNLLSIDKIFKSIGVVTYNI